MIRSNMWPGCSMKRCVIKNSTALVFVNFSWIDSKRVLILISLGTQFLVCCPLETGSMMEGKFLNNKKILVISPESYDHIPVSKHHFSSVLAQLGNKVFFLNPPSETNRVVADEQYPNLFIVDYRAVPGTNRFPGIIRNVVNRYVIQKIERAMLHAF